MIKLNNAKSPGVVYHFTRTLSNLKNIIDNGLRYSKIKEPHMQHRKSFGGSDESYFISTTRSPSAIYQAKGTWKYGLILDNRILTDSQYEDSYFYNLSPRQVTIFVDEDKDGASYQIDTDATGKMHRMTNKEFEQFLDFFYAAEEDPRFACDEEIGEYNLTFDTQEVKHQELPGIVHRMLRTSGNEAEQRIYFPKAKSPGAMDIKKAILGVMVPDTEYYTEELKRFRDGYPNIKMYVYRNPEVPSSSTTYQELKRNHPELNSLYRLPTV